MKKLIIMLLLFSSCTPQRIAEPSEPEFDFTCIQYNTYSEDSNSKVFGYPDTISEAGLIYEWRLSKRKTPEKLMLIKARCESNNQPFIYRLEKRLNLTSCGLFQKLDKDAIEYSIQDQMQNYDSLMNWCMIKANGDIAKAVFYYNTPFGVYSGGEWWVIKTMNQLNKI
jgi:hypothetical protein